MLTKLLASSGVGSDPEDIDHCWVDDVGRVICHCHDEGDDDSGLNITGASSLIFDYSVPTVSSACLLIRVSYRFVPLLCFAHRDGE